MKIKPFLFENVYKFYDLEHYRKNYVGCFLKEVGKHANSGLFYVIHLANCWENYGSSEGLLYISKVWPIDPRKPDRQKCWFKVGAFSPDDLDISLEFTGDLKTLCKTRRQILKLLKQSPIQTWTNTSYREALELINLSVNNLGELH